MEFSTRKVSSDSFATDVIIARVTIIAIAVVVVVVACNCFVMENFCF